MGYFHRTPIRYRFVLLTALVMASLFLLQAYMHHYVYAGIKEMGEFRWWREAPVPYLNFFFWALLTPLVYSILRKWPMQRGHLGTRVPIHLACALLIAAFHESITSLIYYAILHWRGDFDFTEAAMVNWAVQALTPAILSRLMEYAVLMGVLAGLDSAQAVREEQTRVLDLRHELQRSQLDALRKQLQPHFLFNTLNTVSALMDHDTGAAKRVLARLGQLLRITLDKEHREQVCLAREIDHIGHYLGIEQARFEDRLRVFYDVPDDLGTALVPAMILQPLVENAVKHGPGYTSEPVRIDVIARREGQRLSVDIRDNGRGCHDVHAALNGNGIGLRNVRERLRLLYAGDASIRAASPDATGFQVTIELPLRFQANGYEDHTYHRRG